MEKSEKNLHERFMRYGKNAREWMRKCALLLPEIDRKRIWEKKGFGSIYEYAAKLAGMSKNSVESALWTLYKIKDKPALQKVAEEKGILSVKPVANIATPETEIFWADKANGMSKNTLEIYVKEFKKSQNPSCPGTEIPITKQTQNISMELEQEVFNQLQKLKGQGNYNELMKKFLQAYQKQVEAEKPLPVENASRHIPTAIERYVLSKTNGTCAFPCCTKPHEIIHHTERFVLTHSHRPDKLAPLCREHEQLAHLGLIGNEEAAPENWQLRSTADKTNKKYLIDQKVQKYRIGSAR